MIFFLFFFNLIMRNHLKNLINKLIPKKKQNTSQITTVTTPHIKSLDTLQNETTHNSFFKGVRYQLSSNDNIFNNTIPRNVFDKWMNMLENIVDYHLYN